jgi:hypothetical protein
MPLESWEGIVKHAIYHRNNNLGVDESVMWGDYYFVEALDRLASGVGNDGAVSRRRQANRHTAESSYSAARGA